VDHGPIGPTRRVLAGLAVDRRPRSSLPVPHAVHGGGQGFYSPAVHH